ncbi:DinB family protein [Kiloniella sp. EL199]|uniref:DinB family protein n=1 Tax=Kiloniella sp. EL199 TaxID=2107581 RepID=UPI000EA12AF2|nr:DinB family protein [Kiloniella sp. EL199]
MTPDELQQLAEYNHWANQTLYKSCSDLSETEYKAERPSFFGSIHNTLNHILVGDRIWFGRFEGKPEKLSLSDILCQDFASLLTARDTEDLRILEYARNTTQNTLDSSLTYTNIAGNTHCDPMSTLLRHTFNHQTHHRGQVHCLLSQTNVAPPSLDIMYYLRAQD